MTSTAPVCSACVHFTSSRRCSAFPSSPIPDAVWLGRDSHLERIDGQTGDDTLKVRDASAAEYLHKIGRVSEASIVPIA